MQVYRCQCCGQEFSGQPWRHPKYCSRECNAEAQRRANNVVDMASERERFMSYVLTAGTDVCWRWNGRYGQDGYGMYFRKRLGRRSPFRAHRVAHMLFCGPIPDGLVVMHTCDNPACVNPAHLALGTPAENTLDMVLKGRTAQGSAVKSSKLQPQQVREIRALRVQGVPYQEIAERFGITPGAISHIIAGRNWKHLD